MKLLAALALGAVAALAQQSTFVPSAALNKDLPAWLSFSGDYRVRLEGFDGGGFKPSNDDMYLLHRLRLNTLVQPVAWFRVVAQAQDSRIFWNDRVTAGPPYQNTMDLRLAYAEFGNPEGSLVRVGRQELNFGDQRLVGSSNWQNNARSFDAVRATFRHGGYRLDAFAASVVVAHDGNFDHHTPGNNLHGLYGGIDKLVPGATIEPYLFWRLAPGLDSKTTGVRCIGKLPRNVDYGMEVAYQEGTTARNDLRAWAGHWVIGRRLAWRYQPRLFAEYNFASGDKDPTDHRTGTFDQLYPTAHDKYGMADQVGWRNIRDLRFGVEARPGRNVTAAMVTHAWWLASARDGLYNTSSTMIARVADGSAGTRVGNELDAQASWPINKQMQLGAGIGHIFPGPFLKKATPGHPYTFPFLMFGYSF